MNVQSPVSGEIGAVVSIGLLMLSQVPSSSYSE